MTYRGGVPLALFKNTETGASSVIAASGSSYDLNFQQCDYKSSCQSHMRQRVKNVHEGFKYDCTSSINQSIVYSSKQPNLIFQ